VLVLNVGGGWALAGKRGTDARYACSEEVLPGGYKHASWLSFTAGVALGVSVGGGLRSLSLMISSLIPLILHSTRVF
jgi:hypothetical protein